MINIRVCEVPSASVLAFVSFARWSLREAASEGEVELSPSVVEMIGRYLDEWEEQAGAGEAVAVSSELEVAELEYLSHAFLQVSTWATERADERGYDVSPPEADEFYAALSDAVIAALEFAGESSATEFATVLRNNWPRVERLHADGDAGGAAGDEARPAEHGTGD